MAKASRGAKNNKKSKKKVKKIIKTIKKILMQKKKMRVKMINIKLFKTTKKMFRKITNAKKIWIQLKRNGRKFHLEIRDITMELAG